MRRTFVAVGLIGGGFVLATRGALTLDLRIGRRTRPLGPLTWQIEAPREVVFDVIAAPYLGKTPRALQEKLRVWERGSDMALAAHFTPLGLGVVATTVETVNFERPHRIRFRLLRGPVPHVSEAFELRGMDSGTELTWRGELGTDFWALGRAWGRVVSARWEQTVRATLESVKAEAERRTR